MIDFSPLADVVFEFASGELTVSRRGDVSIVNGRRVVGAETPVSGIIGSVWPIAGDDVDVSSDGRTMLSKATVYCLTDLHVADEELGKPGDIITHLGVRYEIVHQEQWARGQFFVYTAIKEQRP